MNAETQDPSQGPAIRRNHRAGRAPLAAAIALAAALAAVVVIANPYPPYWEAGTGAAIHYAPVAWPADVNWIPYTLDGDAIPDRRSTDGSNGGTTPQGYVNVSSGCTDETQPSVYYAYDSADQVLFFRWRVQAPPHNYGTSPNAGSFSSSSPWSSALWTVFIDINGDGFRDFAVHLDGSSGSPSSSIDRLVAIYSTTRSQSLDYVSDPRIHAIAHNPTAFVDGPAGSDRILNFQNSLTATPNWLNGSSETTWDYGTTRASLLSTGCGEYFIDYQIPLSMLDARSVGGPQVLSTTPMSLFFATANSLSNPLQKDAVVAGDFVADPTREVPGGDIITAGGGTVVQPSVSAISAVGCSATALSATVVDRLNADRTSTVASVGFYYYADTDANGQPDDAGSTWASAAAGSASSDPIGLWTASWNSSSLLRGQYLIGVRAADAQGNLTWSHLSQSEVNALIGATPPNYPNGPGVLYATMNNTCGLPGPSVSKSVNPASIAAGQPVTFTVSVANTLASPITVSQVTDTLPAGFTYQSTTGGTIGAATTSPAPGAGGTVQWTFLPAVSIPASSTRTLTFTANASPVGGTYTNTVSAVTSYGTLSSTPTQIGVGSPALTLAKTASVATAQPGDAVTYTVTYSNDSPVNVTNAVITDVLPTGLDFVSVSGGGSYDAGTRTVTWNAGDLQSGTGPFSVTLGTTISDPYPAGAAIPVVNTASIASAETSTMSASSSVYVSTPRPRLAIQKIGSATQVAPAGQVAYTLLYANTGDSTASDVTITDVIPAGWSFVSATAGGANASGSVTWNMGAVPPNGGGSVELVLQASDPYTGANPATNTATISSAGLTAAADSFTVAVTQTGMVCSAYYFRDTTTNVGAAGAQRLANTTPVTEADAGSFLRATSANSADVVELARFYQDPAVTTQVDFSGTLTSSIWIDRAAGQAADVTGAVYDYDPADPLAVPQLLGTVTQPFGGSTRGEFPFTLTVSGALEAGHRLLWVYTFASGHASQAVELAVLYGGTTVGPISATSFPALARSEFCTTAPASPVLDKQVDKLVAAPGDPLTYTLSFANAGGTNITSAQIVDTLPDGVTLTSATLNGSAITPSSAGQVHTFDVRSSDTATSGQITSGQSGTLVLNAVVTAPFTGGSDTLTNTATFASAQTSAIADSRTTTLLRPAVTIGKTAGDTLLAPGDTVTYTLDVLNAGPGTGTDVTVTDVLPVTGYYTYVAGSARLNATPIAPDPVTGGILSSNIGSLAAGATARITFDMLVASSGVPDGVTTLSNTATVSDGGSTGTRSSNTVGVTLTTNPNLTLTKTSTPAAGPVAAGSVLTYTVTVTNVGSGSASNVMVEDLVPGSTSFAAGSLQYAGAAQTDAADGDNAYFDAAGNRAVFAVGTLAGGASAVMTYEVRIASPLQNGTTTIGSTATATASNASTRTATAAIAALAAPVLTLTKSAPAAVSFPLTTLAAEAAASTTVTVASASAVTVGSTVTIGGTAAAVTAIDGTEVTLGTAVTAPSGTPVLPTWEYLLDYENTGTASATGVAVQDVLPAGLTYISADNGGSNAGGTVTWTLGAIAAGAQRTLRVRVAPAGAGSYTNSATLASVELPTVTSNTTTTSVGSLSVGKSTTTPSAGTTGDSTTATYVITIQNQSPAIEAADVTVADLLAPGFSYLSTTSIVGSAAATSPAAGETQPAWTGLSIAAGGTATVTFVAGITNVPPATYQNEVTVTSSNLDVLEFDALGTTAEDVTIAALLGTTGAIAITPTIAPGATLTVTVTDPDLDTDATTAQTAQATVVNTRTNESEMQTLTETGPSTGIFAGTLATLASGTAGANDAAPLNVQDGDTLTASYEDALTGAGGTATVTDTSNVNQPSAANTAPVGNGDAATTAEDTAVATPAATLLSNDTDAESDALTVTSVQAPVNGTVVLNGDDTITFTPAVNFAGTASYTYTISDGNGGSATASVSVTVTAVNDAPVAADDAATVAEDSGASAIDVLANDSVGVDAGETLAVTAVTQGANGSVSFTATGVTYTPAANFNGSDSFSYTISDGNGGSATASVRVTVTAVNDEPLAADDAASVAEDSGANAIAVLTNDSVGVDGGETLAVTAVSQGANGSVAFTATGVSYTPAANFHGSDSFTYTISDGNGGSATASVNVTVTAVNDAPLAADDAATVAEDSGASAIDVLANDSIGVDGGETLAVTAVSQGANGSVAFTATAVTYTPTANFNGSDSFTYTIADGNGGSATASVSVTVTAVNDAPLAADDAATVAEDSGASAIDVLANDSIGVDAGETLAVTAVTQGANGSVSFTATGVSYTPAANFSGSDSFSYTISDGTGSSTATVTVTVTAANDAPVANADAATTAEDTALTVTAATLLANDTDVEGDTLTVTSVQAPVNGTVVLNGDETITFTPAANFSGTAGYTYTIGDGTGSSTATVTVTVTPANDSPEVLVAGTPLGYTPGAGATAVDADLTVSDPDSATLVSATVRISANFAAGQDTLTFADQSGISGGFDAATGELTLTGTATVAQYQDALRSVTFTHSSPSPTDATRTISITVNDGASNSNLAARGVVIAQPPAVNLASAALAYAENDGAEPIDAALTVSDADSTHLVSARVAVAVNFAAGEDVLAFAAVSGIAGSFDAATGVLTLTGSAAVADYQAALRSVTYTNTSGNPSTLRRTISVAVNDGALSSNEGTRSIDVASTNSAPTLNQPAAIEVDEDSGTLVFTITGISSGSADEAQPLTVSATSGDTALFAHPVLAYVSPATTASVTLVPLADAFGSTTLTVTVSDGSASDGSITRVVPVTIRPVNDRPTLDSIGDRALVPGVTADLPLAGITTGAANELQTLVVSASSSHPGVLPHPIVIYSSPAAGGSLRLAPTAFGTATITVVVNDGASVNETVVRSFAVTAAVNLPPTITPMAAMTMIEGNALPAAAFTVGDDATPADLLVVTASSANTALIDDGDLVITGTGSNRSLTVTPRRFRIGSSVVRVSVSDGSLVTTTEFTVVVKPLWDYYLAEGEASDSVLTDITVTNAHGVDAPIRITFVRADGAVSERIVTVPPAGRHTMRISDFPEAGSGGVSTFIRSLNNLPLLVERTVRWDGAAYGGHSETALEATNARWYFAEGAQSGMLSTRLVLANPNVETASVTVNVLTGGRQVQRVFSLPPLSRRAIPLSGIPELAGTTFGIVVDSDLPIVAERSVDLHTTRVADGGAAAAAAPYPAPTWYFAEGSGLRTFGTYLLVANPGETGANFTISYFTASGLRFSTVHHVAAGGRSTIDTVADEPRLEGQHYWMRVAADRPVVAERTMYWDRTAERFTDSHTSRGVLEPALRWATGDARVGGAEGFNTFLLIANPGASAAELRITYYPDAAAPVVTSRWVAGGARDTVHVNLVAPQILNSSFWAVVESLNAVPIVVERSVYWNSGGERWAGGTNVAASPVVPASYGGCEYVISPASLSAPAGGATLTVQVGTTTRCTHTIVSAAEWITVTSGGSGNGAGSVQFIAAPNGSAAARTGQVIVAGRSVSVWQAGSGAGRCAPSEVPSDWVCVNDGWVPPDHPLATGGSGSETSGGGTASTPVSPTYCSTAQPASGWVCINTGWVPPDHPLATGGSGSETSGGGTAPTPVSPAYCSTVQPASGWVCINTGWVPPDHPLATGGSGSAGAGTDVGAPPVVPTGCTTVKPADDWVCVSGGWVPWDHPLALQGSGGSS